ncbi:MAG: SbcC/MukB-like Walker B domain-containing protein [Bacteroidia bacterium]
MFPLKLTIQGLYAFPDEPQVIDFERLTQAQLFGIFGATGSGKSSILEAISFALYGETDRLKKTDRRNFNMLNLRAKRLWIDFEFLGGQDENRHYRFTAEIRRKARNFEETFAPKREAFVHGEKGWKAIETGQISEILGLSYDNFRRTVIIPQGKFQEFLSLGNADRTRMLREIFRLERFELYDKVKKLIQRNDTEITREETLLAQLAEVSKEALSIQEGSLLQQQQAQESATRRLADMEKQLSRFEAQKELLVQRELKRGAYDRLAADHEVVEARKLRLKNYEAARLAFEPLLKRKNELAGELAEASKSLADIQRQQAKNDEERTVAKRTHDRVKIAYEQREQLKLKADEFGRLAASRAVKAECRELEQRLRVGEDKIAEATAVLSQTQHDEQNAETSYRALREAAPDLDAILKARSWQSGYEQLRAAHQQIKSQVEIEKTALLSKKQEAEKTLTQLEISSDTPMVDWLSSCASRLKEAEKQLAKVEKKQLSTHLASIARELKEGEACPVCGATDHPKTFGPEDHIETDLAPMKDAVSNVRLAQQRISLVIPEIEKHSAALATFQKEQAASAATMEAHEADAPLSPKLIESRLAAAKENQEALKASETTLDKAKEAQKAAAATLQKFNDHKQQLNQQYTNLKAKLEAETTNLRYVSADDLALSTVQQLHDLQQEALSSFQSVGDVYEKERVRLEALLAEQNSLKGAYERVHDQHQELMRKEATLVQELQQALQQSDFGEIETVEAVLGNTIHPAEEKIAIEQWTQEYLKAEAAFKQADEQTKAIAYEADAHEQAQAQVAELRQQIEQKLIDIGALQQLIVRMKEQLEEKKAIQKRYDLLQQRADNLKLMRKLFTGSGFVNYVSGIYLRQLCQAANTRFRKLTNNQLQLEPTEDNSFAVRDFLNDGQLRSHKTLSGGQVFQASLCLALALADQVQDRSHSQQRFFFIDEGFGALDKQSLRLVFEALRALRKEKRIVGIISHVEDLQEDIDTFLHITNTGDSGSRVRTSW